MTSHPTPEPEEPLIAAQQQSFNDNPIVTFASNLGQTDANNTPDNTLTSAEVRFQQSFTTGPGGSGFLLNSFSFRAFNGNDFLIVSLWTDEVSEMGVSGPGEKLAELGRVEARYIDHDYTFEYLDVFLFPSTKYWIQFQVRHAEYDIKGRSAQTRFGRTTATEMDTGSLPGWSFGGDVKFGLEGRVVPFRSADDVTPPSNVLVSNLSSRNRFEDVPLTVKPGAFHAQRFTTGSHRLGYSIASVSLLTSLYFGSESQLVVTMHEESSGLPSDGALFTFSGPPVTASPLTEYTYTTPPGARLEPNTNYWLKFTAASGAVGMPDTLVPGVQQIDSGWDIETPRFWRSSPTGSWIWTGSGTMVFALSGSCPAPTQVECADFPTSEATPGRVRLGECSTGVLDDASDRAWFRIDGLEHYRQYRLEVDFLGANVVGGSLDIFSSTMGQPAVARGDLWDSNYDGHAVLDFSPVAVGLSTLYVQVESDNDMNREDDRNRYTGPYTVTLSELPEVQRMVSNLQQRASDRLVFYNIGHLVEDGLTGHVKEMAIDFTTGSHAAGYTLDKLASYIMMGRRPDPQGTARITGVDGGRRAQRELYRPAEHAALGRRDGGHHRRLGHGRHRDPGLADLLLIDLGPGADGDGEQRGGYRQHGRRCHSRPHRKGRRLQLVQLGGRQGGGARGRRRRQCDRRRTGGPRRTPAPPLSLSSRWCRRRRHPRSPSTAPTAPTTSPTLSSARSNGSRATRPGWCWRPETGRTRCTPGRARE